MIKLDEFYDLSNFYPPIHIRGKNVINLVSERGCPYKCTFCAVAEINGRKVRKMDPAKFIDMVEYHHRKGFDSFMFYDDTFSIDKKRTIEIAKEIIRRKMKIKWNCFFKENFF